MTPVQAVIIWTLLFTIVGLADYRRSLKRQHRDHDAARQPGWGHVALYLVTLPFVAIIERARDWFVA